MDLEANRIGEPLALKAFCEQAFAPLEGARKDRAAARARRRALKFALKRLPQSAWTLLWWEDRPRAGTWTVEDEPIEALGVVRALAPASVRSEGKDPFQVEQGAQ